MDGPRSAGRRWPGALSGSVRPTEADRHVPRHRVPWGPPGRAGSPAGRGRPASAAPEGPPYDTTPGDLRLDLARAALSGGLLTALLAARQCCHAYRPDLAGTPPEEPRIGSAP
jgi:hypothetical protein